jgi:hypothetical protein
MAIGTDSTIQFFGTQDEVTVASPAAITDGSFSVSGDTNDWTNDDDSPAASFVLNCTFSVAPAAGQVVQLHCQLIDVQSTNDEPVVDANFAGHVLGGFEPDAVTSSQYLSAGPFNLPSIGASQVYHFFLKNAAGQTMSSGWSLWVSPATLGPHA